MKTKIFSLTLTLLIMFMCSTSQAFTSVPLAKTPIEGFRGIKWGDKVSKYPGEFEFFDTGLVPGTTQKIYNRRHDKTTIGGVEVGGFDYSFDDNAGFYKVAAVVLYFKDRKLNEKGWAKSYADMQNRFQKIYASCLKQWGDPKKEICPMRDGGKSVEYWWFTPIKDNTAVASLEVIYDGSERKKIGTIFIRIFTLKENEAEYKKLEQYRKNRKNDF